MDLLDGRNDARVRPAAADVAAHALADLVVGEPSGARTHVLGYMADVAPPRFREQANRGTDLPGGTVPALKGIVLDEGGLHRVELAAFGEATTGPWTGPGIPADTTGDTVSVPADPGMSADTITGVTTDTLRTDVTTDSGATAPADSAGQQNQ